MKIRLSLNKKVITIFFLFSIFWMNPGMVVNAADRINIQDVTVENLDFPRTGVSTLVEDYAVVKYGNQVLVKGTDYTIKRDGTTIGDPNEISVGTLTITGKGNYTGTLEKEYRLIPNSKYTLKMSQTKMEMSLTGGTRKLSVYTIPSVYMDVIKMGQHRYWTSSNPNVVTVDENGVLTPVGLGTSTITAHYNGQDVTCQVAILQYIRGDVNQDGDVNIKDAMEIMYIVTGRKTLTDEISIIGDLNNDNSINIKDAMEIMYIVTGRK